MQNLAANKLYFYNNNNKKKDDQRGEKDSVSLAQEDKQTRDPLKLLNLLVLLRGGEEIGFPVLLVRW